MASDFRPDLPFDAMMADGFAELDGLDPMPRGRVRPPYSQNGFDGQPGLGGRNPFHENPLGNEKLMHAPLAAETSQLYRLLSANLSSSLGAPGQQPIWNFVLTLGLKQPTGNDVLLPLVAQVSVGSGGVKRAFEVSIVPTTTINIVGPAVDVDIFYDINSYIAGSALRPTISDQTVYGYLSRGECVSLPYRWFWMPQSESADIHPQISGPVPPNAKGVTIFSGNINMYAAGTLLKFYNANVAGPAEMVYTGVQILNAINAGQYLPIPVGCTVWSVDYISTTADGKLSFQLEL